MSENYLSESPGTAGPDHRHLHDAAGVVAGVALLALSALLVDGEAVSGPEARVLRVVNHAPDLPFALAWLPMQLGNLLAVPAAAVVAVIVRRRRLGLALSVAGLGAWLLAKLVKGFVERSRPGALLEGVVLRDAPVGGRGFVSGHAAVVVALATVAWPHLGPRGRVITVVLAASVCLLRLYVGAHLPLDVIGGAGLGLATGAAVRLALGRWS